MPDSRRLRTKPWEPSMDPWARWQAIGETFFFDVNYPQEKKKRGAGLKSLLSIFTAYSCSSIFHISQSHFSVSLKYPSLSGCHSAHHARLRWFFTSRVMLKLLASCGPTRSVMESYCFNRLNVLWNCITKPQGPLVMTEVDTPQAKRWLKDVENPENLRKLIYKWWMKSTSIQSNSLREGFSRDLGFKNFPCHLSSWTFTLPEDDNWERPSQIGASYVNP